MTLNGSDYEEDEDRDPAGFVPPDSVVAVVDPCGCQSEYGDNRDDECGCDNLSCEHYCGQHDLYHCPYEGQHRFFFGVPFIESIEYEDINDEIDFTDDSRNHQHLVLCALDPCHRSRDCPEYELLLAERQRDREDAERRRRGDASSRSLWRNVPSPVRDLHRQSLDRLRPDR